MKIKILALALVITLLACILVACTEPTQTPEATPEPTEDPQLLAKNDARRALSIYVENITTEDGEIDFEEGTVFVVEKEGIWYSFPFVNGQLTDGDISQTEPIAPNGLVLVIEEAALANMPENVTIYIPTP